MKLLYHASPMAGIEVLEPRESNHGKPLIYFSEKRENVLVYLSNAVEKYCRETGFEHDGIWHKWGPYGFTSDGKFQLQEYYPNAIKDTYNGIKGYIYTVQLDDDYFSAMQDIPNAFTALQPVSVVEYEKVENAYDAILKAENQGLISILKYENMSKKMVEWILQTIQKEYEDNINHPEYRYFLKGKFPSIV